MAEYGFEMAEYGFEVTRWPADPRAREALERYVEVRRSGERVHLEGSLLDFRGADLSRMYLGAARLEGANLAGVCLAGAMLAGAWLNGAWLAGADLTGCDLVKAWLPGLRAPGATLRGVWMARVEANEETDLRGADLSGARLLEVSLDLADLRGADLSGVELDRVHLERARLQGATLTGMWGSVYGPIDVGLGGEPELLDGERMLAWMRERGVGEVALGPNARPYGRD